MEQIDFTSQQFFRDPAATIARLREAGPVVEVHFPIVGRVWTTTTQELASRVLKDSAAFTLRQDGVAAGLRWWMPGVIRSVANNMLTMDEPDHTRLRQIVEEAFRRRAILDMEPRILALADGLAADLFADGSTADFVQRYARRLPLAVICELLGLPQTDWPKFMAWMSAVNRLTSAWGILRIIPAVFSLKRYLERRLDAVRRDGGEGLIAELVRVEREGGRISGDEMVSMMLLLFTAGTETTTHLISGAAYEILRDSGLRDWLAADPARMKLAVEEFLRFVSPVQFTKPRFVRKDISLGGVMLKKGDKIMPMLVAANMDPTVNEQPEKLDLERAPNHHLAFGTGIHFCLGHQLARIEAQCALRALLQRWPNLELAVPPDRVQWRRRPGLRAIAGLPVRVGVALSC